MTPKEKATELFNKFSLNYYHVTNAKQCALICVDEIINNMKLVHKPEYTSIFIQEQYLDLYEAIEYYQEVKQEIEKL